MPQISSSAMPTCNWSLVCTGAPEANGEAHGDEGDELIITLERGSTIAVAHDEQTITIEGDFLLTKVGGKNLHLVSATGFDPSAGATGLSGKLALDLSERATFSIEGAYHRDSGEVTGMAALRVRF
jgi:hypothetical protein